MNGPTSASLTERVDDELTPGRPDLRVSDVMLRRPKVLDAQATVDEARVALANDHVHMVLLSQGSTLVGTLVRADLPPPSREVTRGVAPHCRGRLCGIGPCRRRPLPTPPENS